MIFRSTRLGRFSIDSIDSIDQLRGLLGLPLINAYGCTNCHIMVSHPAVVGNGSNNSTVTCLKALMHMPTRTNTWWEITGVIIADDWWLWRSSDCGRCGWSHCRWRHRCLCCRHHFRCCRQSSEVYYSWHRAPVYSHYKTKRTVNFHPNSI